MSPVVQQVLVAAAVVGALLYLVLRARSRKRGKGACNCAKKDPLN